MKSGVVRIIFTVLMSGILAAGLACSKAPTDSQLTAQIQSKFQEDSGLQGKQISVETSGGVVTLSGTVDNQTQRTAAARYASAVPGTKEVVNNLQTAAAPAPDVARQKSQPTPPPVAKVAKPRPGSARRHDKSRANNDAAEIADNSGPEKAVGIGDENPAPPPDSQSAVPPPPPVPVPAPKKVIVQAGTSVPIRLVDAINSEKNQVGDTFRATLDSPLPGDGDSVPSGYDVLSM